MNLRKKIFLPIVIFSCSTSLYGMPIASSPLARKQSVTLEEVEQMNEINQLATAISVSIVRSFLERYPRFITSVLKSYAQDSQARMSEVVAEKVINRAQQFIQEEGDQVLKSILVTLKADEDTAQMVNQIKPLIENLFIQELMKWFYISSVTIVSQS